MAVKTAAGTRIVAIKVKYPAPTVNVQFTVRVYTQLNSAANDESFGIDNVVLTKIWIQKADFSNPKDFQVRLQLI